MKIIKIKGGLGNQLFQYSFAKLIEKITGEETLIDMSTFQGVADDPVRKPRLLKCSIKMPIATDEDINKCCILNHKGNLLSNKYRAKILVESILNHRYYLEKNRAYIDPITLAQYKYYDGYWQSWRYVDSILPECFDEFAPNYNLHESTKDMIKTVSNQASVFVGIRRGDYATEKKHYGCFDDSYYQAAMNYINKREPNAFFYVFSNDIAWVKENINFSGKNVCFREEDQIIDDYEDLLIMASCKHSIIINSTYHWWGARLNDNPEKMVIAPSQWFADNKPIDIIPPNWIRI